VLDDRSCVGVQIEYSSTGFSPAQRCSICAGYALLAGLANLWGFAIYCVSHDDYEESFLPR
jgi:hypothetical protein